MSQSGTLYICATPIGNLEDITLRAVNVLRQVDLIAAEDTRHTLKLLNHLGIKKPLISYFEHNRRERGEAILKKLMEGLNVALVSDAGTPAIADPGEDLAALCIENGIKVVPVPGACAVVAALSAAGLPTGRFSFQGFLTTNKRKRREHLESVKGYPETLVFYEAPHKLMSTLNDMLEILGDRRVALCRELTKAYEEIIRCSISEAISKYGQSPPKGEFVLVIEGAATVPQGCEKPIEELYKEYIESGMDEKEAVKAAAHHAGIPKREAYARLKIK